MGNTRDTGYLRNLVAYDASGNIVLPANLTVTGSIVGYATTSYVTTQINNLINGAPGLLDTLDELAAALGDDANFASTITTSIAGKQTALNGTGFVKISGTTISYDNTSYLPLGGGTLTGTLNIASEGSYFGLDAQSTPRLGFVKVSGAQPFLGFAADPFTIKVSSGSTIAISNTFTTALSIATSGASTFSSSVTANSLLVERSVSRNMLGISSISLPTSGVEEGVAVIKTNSSLWQMSVVGYGADSKGVRIYNNGGTGYTSFEVATSSGTPFIVSGSGNVGVNTPAPLERLSVTGNIHVAGVGNSLTFDTDGTGRSISQFAANLYEFHILNSRGNSSRFILGNTSISLGTSATPMFHINTTTGNIGIGFTNPQYRTYFL